MVIYALLGAFCLFNVGGFVVFGADVDNYEELVKVCAPCRARFWRKYWRKRTFHGWLKGAALCCCLESLARQANSEWVSAFYVNFELKPVSELRFLLVSIVIFLPFFSLYIAHSLIYLRKTGMLRINESGMVGSKISAFILRTLPQACHSENFLPKWACNTFLKYHTIATTAIQHIVSTKTHLLTKRLFDTFSTQVSATVVQLISHLSYPVVYSWLAPLSSS